MTKMYPLNAIFEGYCISKQKSSNNPIYIYKINILLGI